MILPLLVLLPLLGSVASLLLPRRAGLLSMPLALANLGLALSLAWQVAVTGAASHALGGWGAPLGILLVADGLAALLLAATALAVTGLTVYSTAYFGRRDARHFWPLWWLFVASVNAVFVAGDLFNLYVCLELLGLSAVALAGLGGGTAALAAALRYLLATIAGSLAYLLGVALLYRASGTLDLAMLAGQGAQLPGGMTAFALMATGLLLKAAVFPLHFWLPPAHASAPAPVSAALSAIAVKAPLYLLLRLWLGIYGGEGFAVATVFALIGGVGVIWCSLQAILQTRAKMLVAYSTVAQLGYLLLALALVPTAGDAAFGAFLLLLLAHLMAKAGLFLAVGNLVHRAGHDRIADFDRAVHYMPVSAAAIALAGVSLMGLPPSGGFSGKWLLLQASLEAGRWAPALLLLLGGVLAAVYTFKLIEHTFTGGEPAAAVATPGRLEWAALALAAGAILLGFAGSPILALLGPAP